ncbi:murein hydrolase activator EnvC family protein [Nitrosophilus kaiyonis]|uniref:murein hydrolase activator EnvC family protein n=1 Tax=Nitrosophilus kaiyonis TaxID=2930200 RepID=UPI00249369F6|nr:peptidoglycan DD-metalloendopeptidase family protein [Nitrosophilus kaiyonis]
MRYIGFLIIFVTFLFAKNDLERKIYYSKQQLYRKEKSLRGLNLKLEKIAKDIEKTRKALKNIDKKLKKLQDELKEKEEFYKISKEKIKNIKENESSLLKKQNEIKEKLTILIAKYFSKSLILEKSQNLTTEDIINEEILKALKKSEKQKIKMLNSKFIETKKIADSELKKLQYLQNEIENLDKKRKEYEKLKKNKKESLKLLSYKKRKYKEAIENLLKEQKSLRETLNKLQILKSEKVSLKDNKSSKIKVKTIGKSYLRAKTLRYKGPKTIPPLDRFVIVKKYGSYIDPIYNIKIFNESIELKPLKQNAKVKNVLNGRVVLAKKTPHLNNVIIIKHKNGLYTIYAHIDKIAPTIKKGKKVKKGYVIGRVNSKLTFEVTKNRYHINPLDLIKVR